MIQGFRIEYLADCPQHVEAVEIVESDETKAGTQTLLKKELKERK